jgi:hypothetical protein
MSSTNKEVGEKIGFMFLPSYFESYEILKNDANEEVADMFLHAVIYYGIRHENIATDYRVQCVMASIVKTIDKGQERYRKRLERTQDKLPPNNPNNPNDPNNRFPLR